METERRCHSYLSLKTFDQMTDCHTAGDGVRIDNHIRCDSFTSERHVLHGEIDSIKCNTDHLSTTYKIQWRNTADSGWAFNGVSWLRCEAKWQKLLGGNDNVLSENNRTFSFPPSNFCHFASQRNQINCDTIKCSTWIRCMISYVFNMHKITFKSKELTE